MTTPSLFEQSGICIHVSDPVLQGGAYLFTLQNYNAYSHVSSAWLGFDTAQITVNGDQSYIEDWIENGLGRDITVYNEGGQIAWQGFVNQLSANLSGLSYTCGPMLEMANRVAGVYSPKDTAVSPPPPLAHVG